MKQLLWALVASTSVATYSHAQANLHAPFDVLLQKYVSASGKVDYKGFRAEKAALGTYLTALGKQVPTARSDKNAALAYWINAYNAFTIQLIVENYPVKSITQLSGGKPWDVKFIELGGKKYSLNQIENDIIRPQFKDARIHFALNCAAVSCPPLANTAYTEANVQALLTARTKRFVNNPDANELSATKATLSKLFDWYKADFGNLPAFINQYSTIQLNANAVIAYKEYDWNLNDR